MIYVGVDIALNKSGVVVTNEDLLILDSFLVAPDKKLPYYEKLADLHNKFFKLFTDLSSISFTFTLLLEGRLKAGFGANTLASIEGARVAALLAYLKAMGKESPFYVLDPNKVKYHITGNRVANKAMVSSIVKLPPQHHQEDVVDAYCLCKYFLECRTVL